MSTSDAPQAPYGAPQAGGTGPQAGPGPYAQPPYGYPYPPYPYPPMQPGTNTMAILALVFAFVCAPAAIVMGALARKQIRRTGEQGMGMATAGFVLGIVFTVLSVIWIIVALVLFASVAHQVSVNDSNNGAVVFAAARAYFGL